MLCRRDVINASVAAAECRLFRLPLQPLISLGATRLRTYIRQDNKRLYNFVVSDENAAGCPDMVGSDEQTHTQATQTTATHDRCAARLYTSQLVSRISSCD